MAKGNIRLVLHMDIMAYKGRPISILLMNLHIICTNTLVQRPSCRQMDAFLKYRGRVGRWWPSCIACCSGARQTDNNKKMHSGVDCQTVTKCSDTRFANFNEHFVEIML